ncbi:hypothetical protein BVC93_10235 [Mycobacterium sp. MS1601]|uniref:ABC transporter ATP-binding protein n=1 Tax=Mycobacterium sp. MS1601 TaxID=1936029 RepID=UPI000979592E|nr:ABC transporter ATP-binding protein [Mycobacterium sp. MS1601]AQA02750.1 hypothetical protein BVC93_10235 [Mycobacterium sp. MS1601]
MSESKISGAAVHVRNVDHHYGGFHALKGVDLDIQPAEFMTLLGSSGSGKTTLLQAIGGLIEPSQGEITVDGNPLRGLPPERRDMGFVFQNYALFPHMTVQRNVAFPLEMRRMDRRTVRERVGQALELVGLDELAHRHPAELSGGQQQRVALARAITFQPRVLLLDEPLGALDRQLRQQLGLEIRRVQRELGITTIYVTHDQEEAFVLSSRIAVMREGNILQVDTPERIYRNPADLFVATFLGDLNVLTGSVVSSDNESVTVSAGGTDVEASTDVHASRGTPATIGLRPEELQVRPLGGAAAAACFRARIDSTIFGGGWVRYSLVLADGQRLHAVDSGAHDVLPEGSDVDVSYTSARTLVFFGANQDQVNSVKELEAEAVR